MEEIFKLTHKHRMVYNDSNPNVSLENEFNESDTLEDLIEKRPELNDLYSEHSIVLKKGGILAGHDFQKKMEFVPQIHV